MADNQILPFSQGAGANVLLQTPYADDPQRVIGNQPGVARAQLVNKALLQVSAVAAGVAQFLAQFQGVNITDQLTSAQYVDIIKNALNASGVFVTQPPGDQSTKPATCAFVQQTVGAAINAGAIVHFPGTTAPAGYVKANGALLSRTTYANLWAYAQSSGNISATDGAWTSGQFSPGDGSTTFRIPDLRGYHLRSWDDARGIDPSRAIGTIQADALLSHGHGITDPGHGHTVFDPGHSHTYSGALAPTGGTNSYQNGPQGYTWRAETHTGTFSTSHNTAGGLSANSSGSNISILANGSANETRVKNIAYLVCIKF